jgi:hypothetical protein
MTLTRLSHLLKRLLQYEVKSVTDKQGDAYQEYEDEALPRLVDAANTSTTALTDAFKAIQTCDHKKHYGLSTQQCLNN